MKILHINFSDNKSGAAKAVYRLHKSLLKSGINSEILVQRKEIDDYTIDGPISKYERLMSILRPTLDEFPLLFYRKRKKALFSPSFLLSSKLIKLINDKNPDIVHLHWITGGMLRIEDIVKIKQPIIWSLHDMWAFTGGCHYDKECGKYKEECGNCHILNSNKKNDLSRKIFLRKQKAFESKKDLIIVGLSSWLNNCSRNSSLLKGKKHINLPNTIDANIFSPFNKEKSRELWNLPKDKKLILFGAMGATSDLRKGFKKLNEAMYKLTNKKIELVVFGSSKPKESQNFGFKTHYLGELYDDVSLVTLYSAVDVTIVPSLQENLSNVIMESLACATPVAGFNIGGNSDMIEHKQNGYLAKSFDSSDLAYGIEWILNNINYNELCLNAREKVLKEFDSKVVVKKYIALYKDFLYDR